MSEPVKLKPRLKVKLTPASPAPASTDSNVSEQVEKQSRMKLRDEDLEFIQELGAGSGGTVSKVMYKPQGIIMARKNVNIFDVDESEREKTEKRLLRELKILKMCKSPYIVTYYGAFAHEGDITICMELMDMGALDHVLSVVGAFDEEIVGKITIPCLRGLQYLYDEHKIVHRDIKPSNILLNSAGEIKIADFGVSKEVNGTMAKTFTGTQGYLAPERVREGKIHGVESDIWALGLSLMELATGEFPYPPLPSIIDLLRFIEDEPSPSLDKMKFSRDFCLFCQNCLIKDPTKRPGPAKLLEEPFCKKYEQDFNLKEWAVWLKTKL